MTQEQTAANQTEPIIIGQIIRQYRMENDISAPRFAAACGRSPKWTFSVEATGRGYERTWVKMGKEFPDLKQAIIKAIGRFPPQEYTRLNHIIQRHRDTLRG